MKKSKVTLIELLFIVISISIISSIFIPTINSNTEKKIKTVKPKIVNIKINQLNLNLLQ